MKKINSTGLLMEGLSPSLTEPIAGYNIIFQHLFG